MTYLLIILWVGSWETGARMAPRSIGWAHSNVCGFNEAGEASFSCAPSSLEGISFQDGESGSFKALEAHVHVHSDT